jgi:hypothetical protein
MVHRYVCEEYVSTTEKCGQKARISCYCFLAIKRFRKIEFLQLYGRYIASNATWQEAFK